MEYEGWAWGQRGLGRPQPEAEGKLSAGCQTVCSLLSLTDNTEGLDD